MAKEIKDFEVWRPPPPEPRHLFEPEDPIFYRPPTYYTFSLLKLHPNTRLTPTGIVWLLLPWFFIFWKRLQFSLLELMLLVFALGIANVAIAKNLNPKEAPVLFGLLTYIAIHVCLLAFTYPLYAWALNRPSFRPTITKRTGSVCRFLIAFSLTWIFFCLVVVT